MRKLMRPLVLVALAITVGFAASSNASAAMLKTVVETVKTVQNTFTIMAAAPAQPAAPTVVAGNKSATLTWTAPTNNGAAITSYTVTSNPGEHTCTVNALTCVVSGLTNETSYTFTVKATNSLGTSVQSNQSSAVTPTHMPRQLSKISAATNYSTHAAFSADGRYAFIATDTVPPSIVKFDFETKSVVETLDLASNTPAINEVAYDADFGYFFYSGGFAKLDLAGMYVLDTPAFGTLASKVAVDETGAYLLRSVNPTVNDSRTYLKKYDAVTGLEVGSLTLSTSSSTEIREIRIDGDAAYLMVQSSSRLTMRKVQVSTMALNAANVEIDPGKNGTNFFVVDATILVDGTTMVVTYRSDDQFSSLSGNKIHIARFNLATMTLLQLTTVDNGADYGISYNAVAHDGSEHGYWLTNSSTTADGYLQKISLADLSVSAKSTFATKTSVEAAREYARVATTYGTSLFVFGESSTVGWMREYALGDVPNEPTNLTAQYGDEQATLTWAEPTDLGIGTDVTYEVTSTNSDFGCVTTELTCTITGLTNGTSYVFNVTASNTDGTGITSSTTSVTPKRKPDAPTAASAVYGAGSATVSWSAPANNGGAAITSYTVTSTPDSKTCVATTTRTCVVRGLTNGTTYSFTVKASNVVGASAASTATNEVIPRTVPGSPTAVAGAFGNTQVTVSWVAPASNGGAAIAGYRVVATPGGQSCTTDATVLNCAVTGLTNGTAYTFAVTTQNSEGSSATASTGSVTPATVPSAPGKPTFLEIGDKKVILRWDTPLNHGGATTSSYLATANPGGLTCTSLASSSSCAITGLTNGTSYTFSVVARNIAGSSAASPVSNAAVPRTNPSAPTGVTAEWGNRTATVKWSAPSSDGGFAISTYKVTDGNSGVTRCTVSAPTTSCTVTGLVNGSTYSFRVIATNGAALVSTGSAASNQVVPKTTPSVVNAVVATPQDSATKLTWTAPVSNGGSSITSYKVTAAPGGATCTSSGTSCTVTGLTNGSSYSFTIVATNVVGDGLASSSVSAIPNVLPAAPTSVELTAGEGALTATWLAPAANGGTSILSYRATATPGDKFCEVAAPTLTCEITGLTNGTAYTVKVTATNDTGNGPESAPSSPATPKTRPSAPAAPTIAVGDGQLTVSWNAPTDGGSPILSYTVTEVEDPELTCTVLVPVRSCTIGELANGLEYSFVVKAKNVVGDSDASPASTPTAPLGVPDAPSIAELVYGSGSITVSWSEPILDGGSPVVTYVVTASPGGKTCATNLLECTVSGLTNGTEYTFTVKARNAVGLGPASESSDPIAPWAAPNAPTGIKAVAGEGEAEVSWIAPTNTDFDTTSYVATSEPGGFSCEVTADVTCTVSGLDNGVGYTFTVVATNFSGSSKASAVSAVATPRTTPDAPQQVVPRVVSTGIEVNWIAPAFDGGAKVSFYTAYAYDTFGEPLGLTCVTSGTSCIIKGLTRGEDYSFTVAASNVVGASGESDASEAVTFGAVPSRPTSVFAISGPSEMTVSWAAPLNTGGSDIAYYVAESTPGGFVCVVEGQSCVISGLANGTKYTFTVRAANEFGESDNSIASAAGAPVARPGQPSVVESAFISYDQLLVRWTAASDAVSAYRVSLLEPNYPYDEIDTTTVDSDTLTYTFEGLNPGAAYRVQVIAYGGGADYIRAAAAPARKVGPVMFTEYPTLTGTALVSKTIMATDGVFVGLPEPRLSRTWYRCTTVQVALKPLTKDCLAIKGATAEGYKLTASDLGKYIAFSVAATNAYGETVATGVLKGKVVSAPIVSKASTFSGTAKNGKTLTAKSGTWIGTSKIVYKYQWMRCSTSYKASTSKGAKCVAISKATKTTYKLTSADVGKYVRVVVTGTNSYGKSESHAVTSKKVTK